MTLFCLIYPSQFLTKCYEPIDCMNRGLSLKEIEKEIREKITKKLSRFDNVSTGTPDTHWYYVAPLLMDSPGYVADWLNSGDNLASFDDDDDKTDIKKGFLAHIESLKELYRDTKFGTRCNLGKQPDDLIDVLTDMAIASPAVAVNRTYQSYCKNGISFAKYLPSQIANIFIKRMNTPEATATVELACGKKSDDAHWQNLLTYCKHGNIQAMFDEYAHIISNGLDDDSNLIEKLNNAIASSMNIRTTSYKADTYNGFKARVSGGNETTSLIRTHFAVAFTKGDGKEKDVNRKKTVRNAFNSPFRPFVLASTSIGQEGLDFHNYCRRIVHWNLPSNPIDLEQREGRINRFECLAIRQNIAKRYGDISFESNVWKEMFETAEREENGGKGSDLIPFWGLTKRDDMVKIERIVPMYPFSRDLLAYERLIKILSLYRLTLGQARQEELLDYILESCDDIDSVKKQFINLSPYYLMEEEEKAATDIKT
ncbi:MAG: helicase-related protein [Acutalibacteraceae bacterium]